jgi:type III secretory pathway component EscV
MPPAASFKKLGKLDVRRNFKMIAQGKNLIVLAYQELSDSEPITPSGKLSLPT